MQFADDTRTDVLKVAVSLAASLIAVDGVIEEEEKQVAVKMGHRLLPAFSEEAFYRALDDLDELPSAYELASSVREVLDDESKDTILNYLMAVATADDLVVEVEHQELEAVADALGVPLPPLEVAPPGA